MSKVPEGWSVSYQQETKEISVLSPVGGPGGTYVKLDDSRGLAYRLLYALCFDLLKSDAVGVRLVDALMDDCEQGVQWLNQKHADEFRRSYPNLNKFIAELACGMG